MIPSRLKTILTAACIVATAMPAFAAAQGLPPLRENEKVSGQLLSAAIGDEIRKNCPSISPRYLTFLRRKWQLERYAVNLGYSRAEIEAFIESKDEQNRMKTSRDAYLKQKGVVKGSAESYCRLGREEIARGTFTGSLLREN